ncbi:MAG: class I SAM-dependent RNA methyltransferase [Acidobacteria bacterium]|nr:class I SAM-dependent RNA methyltransferase [Acidobacteriota bacterium]
MDGEEMPHTFTLRIERLVYGGAGLGRHEGKVVFVPFSAPGDTLLVRPVEEKKNFVRASAVRILDPGPGRTDPACPHFGACGGCHWQHLEYARQVEAKRGILEELLHHRFPETAGLPVSMAPSPQPFGYRSRARMRFAGTGAGAAVGFFRGGSHTILDIDHCPLFQPSLNEALKALRVRRRSPGAEREPGEIDIACSEQEGAWAVGPGRTLRRQVGGFTYRLTPDVFFQANDFLVEDLAVLVDAAARDCDPAAALDLYAGVGVFSLPLARTFRKVVAVEGSPSACRLLQSNAAGAGFGHLQTVCADVADWMQGAEARDFGLVVLDPPRTGAGERVMEQLRRWRPGTITYVSCDPQTLCRDLARLVPDHYRIDSVAGLDLFPQSYHFETVVRLARV